MAIDTYDLTNPTKPTIVKDASAVLDYTFDWTLWLDDIADTITGKAVGPSDPVGLTVDSSVVDATLKKVTVWLSGGTAGTKYKIDCQITTAFGRTDSRSIYVKVKDR